jgi:DNA modification methylase
MGTNIASLQQELPFENRGFSKDQKMKYLNIQPNNRFQERYKLHQYWARKPWYVVKRCIERFTDEGDTILDPFCGSGVTACESLISRRKVIALDLNPIASLITKVTCCSPINLNVFGTTFEKIKEKISDNLSLLYNTECPKCGKSATIINTLWRNSDPYGIFYYCKFCRESNLKDITDYDRNKNYQIDGMNIPYWYPKGIKLSKDADVSYLDALFTKRNIIALSILNNEIETVKEDTLKPLFRLMFSSIIPRTSKLVFVNDYRFKKGINPAGVLGEKRFWVPAEYVENNVFYYFKARFFKFMKAKRETNNLIGNYYKEGETIQIHTGSATNLSMVSSNSIDYCFTDPPYGGAIKYLDLSVLWNSWLQFPTNGNKEIIVKNGNFPAYQTLLQKAFQEIYRVLKPRAYLSVTFHSTNISVWRSLLEACRDSGFCLSSIIPLSPIKSSHNQIDMRGTVKTDLLLTFKKSGMEKFVPMRIGNPPNIQKIIILAAKELIEKDGSASTAEIYDKVIINWSSIVYQYRKIPKKVNLSINSLRKTLVEHLDFESFEKIVSDYKGKYRRIEKWRMKTLGS